MATSLDTSVDLSAVILDLDSIQNIGHPCLEMLQPNPDVYKLFEYFNEIFFDGILKYRVNLEWLENIEESSAGKSYLPEEGENRMRIILNSKLMRNRSRKDIIETLLHEMIHTYLMHTNTEDEYDQHGANFIAKMYEINSLARLNITTHHNYHTGKPSRKGRENTNENLVISKYYMWRCQGECRNASPYFGFMWIEEDREPCPAHLMWIDTDECEHIFEKFGNHDNPKGWLIEWECIVIFNQFILDNKIQIKSKILQTINGDAVAGAAASNRFVIDAVNTTVQDSAIANELYVNFNTETKKFINMSNYLAIDLPENSQHHSSTACMICCGIVNEENIIEHLKQCSGLEFSLESEEALPIVKITNQ